MKQTPNTNKIENKFNITVYLNMITRRRYLLFSIFALITIISIAYSYTAKKVYKASATVLVEKEKIINPLIRGLAVAQTPAERLSTIRQLILSRSRLTSVIKKLDLDLHLKTPLQFERLIINLRRSTTIEITGKNLYRISYEGENPKLVQDIVNTICNLFIEENLGATRGNAQEAFSFIKTQLETYQKKLEESESALRAFKEKNLGQLPGEEGDNLKKLETYQNLLAEAEQELQEAKLHKSLLEKQINTEQPLTLVFSSSSSDSNEANPLKIQLNQLKLRLSSLLNKYTEKYPEVVSLKVQIKKIEQQLSSKAKKRKRKNKKGTRANSTTKALNPIYQQMKEDLGNISVKINVLESRVQEYKQKTESYKEKVKSIPKLEQELVQLKRGYDVNAGIYKTLLNKLEEARISRELELREKGGNFQIIDLAQLPLMPSKPNRPKLILLGMLLGLLAAFATNYLFYYLDNSVKSLQEAKSCFTYPILAAVPLIICEGDTRKKRIKNFLFFSTFGVFVAAVLALIIRELTIVHFILR